MAPEMTAVATDLSSSQHPMLPRPFRVVRYRQELKDTFTVFLEPEDGTREFLFQPGQFNMIYLPGAGEVPISISGDPAKPGQLVHTIRAVGNVTNLLHKTRPGDIVGSTGPLRHPMAGGRGRGPGYRYRGRRPGAGAAATGNLPGSGQPAALRQF